MDPKVRHTQAGERDGDGTTQIPSSPESTFLIAWVSLSFLPSFQNHIFMTNRSLCYASMKNWPKSLRDADKAIALKGDWEKGWYRRGVALSNMEKYEEAMQAFQKCLDLNPSSKDYETQYNQAKRDLYKGLTESEILKLEGNEVRPHTPPHMQDTESKTRRCICYSRVHSHWLLLTYFFFCLCTFFLSSAVLQEG